MTKIVCACTECKYNDDRNRCTAKDVELSWHSVVTMHDGRQEFLKCKTYQIDDRSRELAEKLSEFMRKHSLQAQMRGEVLGGDHQ